MERIEFEDQVTNSVLKSLGEIGIENATTYFPMLRVVDGKLYVGTVIDIPNEELQSRKKCVRPRFWAILDINDFHIVELNKTEEKDYMDSNVIAIDEEFDDDFEKKVEALSEFENIKKEQYKKYLYEDINLEITPSKVPIINKIDNKIIVDGQVLSADNYLISQIKEDVENKVDELVEIMTRAKYSEIIYYYVNLVMEIIDEYKKTNTINKEKINLASNIIDEYYGKNYGIKYFFNIND